MSDLSIMVVCYILLSVLLVGLFFLTWTSSPRKLSKRYDVNTDDNCIYYSGERFLPFGDIVQIYFVRVASFPRAYYCLRFQGADGQIWDFPLPEEDRKLAGKVAIMSDRLGQVPETLFHKVEGNMLYGETIFIVGRKYAVELTRLTREELKNVSRGQ